MSRYLPELSHRLVYLFSCYDYVMFGIGTQFKITLQVFQTMHQVISVSCLTDSRTLRTWIAASEHTQNKIAKNIALTAFDSL